jgi:hypothetical protein
MRMGNLGAKGVAAALCLGLIVTTARADEGDGGDLRAMPPTKPSWWSGTFAAKAPATPKAAAASAETPPPRVATSNPGSALFREQNAYIRRLEVCDDLLDIAERTGNEALREQVNQLKDKAWAVYQQRTAASGSRMADEAALLRPTPTPSDSARRAAVTDAIPSNQPGEQ